MMYAACYCKTVRPNVGKSILGKAKGLSMKGNGRRINSGENRQGYLLGEVWTGGLCMTPSCFGCDDGQDAPECHLLV